MPRKKNPTGVRDKAGVASVTYAAKRKNIPPAGLFACADAARCPASDTPPEALVAGGTTAETNAAGQPAAERGGGRGPDGDGATRGTGGTDWFAAFYGGLRGTVTIAPGTDLTAPVAGEWDEDRDR